MDLGREVKVAVKRQEEHACLWREQVCVIMYHPCLCLPVRTPLDLYKYDYRHKLWFKMFKNDVQLPCRKPMVAVAQVMFVA